MSIFNFLKKKHEEKPPKRILSILKRRTLPFYDNGGALISSGLKNSATFITDMLNNLGHNAWVVDVTDNNDIDREITNFDPDIVIIEALWVVPEKFDVLKKLHPKIKWIVRLHSETPFLALEGIAMEWVHGYAKRGITIAANSTRLDTELKYLLPHDHFTYLPNYYPMPAKIPAFTAHAGKVINIGCFGAIRPLKNHAMQALSAIKFADDAKLILNFHINVNRCEDQGEPVLRNLRALFANHPNHNLVEHPWVNHPNFMEIIGSMDISMQVSFSETFNIVSCDAAIQNVPMVVSPEVSWANEMFQANPNSSEDIVKKLNTAWTTSRIGLQRYNFNGLRKFDDEAIKIWKEEINKL